MIGRSTSMSVTISIYNVRIHLLCTSGVNDDPANRLQIGQKSLHEPFIFLPAYQHKV
jgi:hypothetical protein